MPLRPAVRFCQKVSRSLPTGVITPIPVTTTLREWLIGRAKRAENRASGKWKLPFLRAASFSPVHQLLWDCGLTLFLGATGWPDGGLADSSDWEARPSFGVNRDRQMEQRQGSRRAPIAT